MAGLIDARQSLVTVLHISGWTMLIVYHVVQELRVFSLTNRFPRSGKSQGKMKKFQGHGKVREILFESGKFKILAKVREF